ncbi:MAG: hypothetical protein ACXV5H_01250 [Halobacteriota archaeon]
MRKKRSALPPRLRVVVAMAVEMVPALAAEMAVVVVQAVVVAIQVTPSIR